MILSSAHRRLVLVAFTGFLVLDAAGTGSRAVNAYLEEPGHYLRGQDTHSGTDSGTFVDSVTGIGSGTDTAVTSGINANAHENNDTSSDHRELLAPTNNNNKSSSTQKKPDPMDQHGNLIQDKISASEQTELKLPQGTRSYTLSHMFGRKLKVFHYKDRYWIKIIFGYKNDQVLDFLYTPGGAAANTEKCGACNSGKLSNLDVSYQVTASCEKDKIRFCHTLTFLKLKDDKKQKNREEKDCNYVYVPPNQA
ncbi:unknown protein [Seminavis robusta]|uniref:Uncharacterized protein n=1 Tax=Seminavis robusta TaxID=568900 RepID=A0A9N8F0U2_9STRA|nr:unknown protein [Seminavis robusta]|eukprot:Sro2666_g334160.1 n/a (251) ;mRNA; f:1011-1856